MNRDPISPPSVRMPLYEKAFYVFLVGFIVGALIGALALRVIGV